MYVTVSLKIELDANASLSDMERQIQAAGRRAMQDALQQAIRQSEDLPGLWKRAAAHTGDKATGAVDEFWAGGSASPTAALSAVPPAVSPCR